MNRRDKSFDILRIISCIGVIYIHAASFYYSGTTLVSKIPSLVIDGFCKCFVDVYVMLSGAIFLSNPNRNIKKSIQRLLIIFLVWGLFYTLYSNGLSRIESVISSVLEGGGTIICGT